MPNHFYVAVDRRFSELLLFVPFFAVTDHFVLGDLTDWHFGEVGQEYFRALDVELLDLSICKESCKQFPEFHFGVQFGRPGRLKVEFEFVLAVKVLGGPDLVSSCGFGIADTVLPDVAPVHVSALIQTHGSSLGFE